MKQPCAALLLTLLVLYFGPASAAIDQSTVQKLLAADNAAGDHFGYSVALDGGTALIGAPYDDDQGSAYVFVRAADGTWRQQAKLTAGDGAAEDSFGYSVAVADGAAVIGAPYDDDQGNSSGSAYVFVRAADGTWSRQAKLAASDGAAEDSLGFSVALDGGTAVIGAKNCDPATFLCSGSAYVFVRSAGSIWNQQAKLAAGGGSANEVFLRSVSVSGNIALVGADGYDGQGFPSGAAYVFVRSPYGTWSQEAKLSTSDGNENDSFGSSVAVDGNTALIGTNFSGSAYVFVRSADGTWRQQAKLTAGDAAPDYYAFNSVAVDGDTAVIGLVRGSESDDYSAGAAYVFARSANGTWSQQARLTAPVFNYFGYFGYSVSLDDKAALIGSWGDTEPGSWSGAAYVFTEGQTNPPPVLLTPVLPLLLLKD